MLTPFKSLRRSPNWHSTCTGRNSFRNLMVNAPEHGYRQGERQSQMARKYLRLYEDGLAPGQLRTRMVNGRGELTIPADGWTDFFNVRTNPILRSNFWDVTITVNRLKFRQRSEYSGCPKCYPERTQKLAGGRTQEELFQLTEKRLQWSHG